MLGSPTATSFTAHRPSSLPTAAIHPHPPLPSQEGCGPVKSRLTRAYEGETQGGTQEVGGPAGASRKRATTFVVAHFRPFFFPPPADHPSSQRQHGDVSQEREVNHRATRRA